MKEVPISTCERDFVVAAAKSDERIDGRQTYDVRAVRIRFGAERGTCQVLLGKTRAFANVSCEITAPKASRSAEGILHVNLELSPMAAPHYEPGRASAYGVECNRLLERCLCESRCIDLESLCIVSGEKVWTIRVDVHVLDDDGSVVDCASLAAITALCHFRRPVFTVSGEEVIVYPPEEREPVPLTVYHVPICTTIAFFDRGQTMVLDPTDVEQRVADGKMVLGMTAHRELCTLHLSGKILLRKEQVMKCVTIVSKKVVETTAHLREALNEDTKARASGTVPNFASSETRDSVLDSFKERAPVDVPDVEMASGDAEQSPDESVEVVEKGPGTGTARVGEGGPCTWEISDDSEPEERKPEPKHVPIETIELTEDSEEEEIVVLEPEGPDGTQKEQRKSRNWYAARW